ncbi:MAG: tyrosine/phenylalanine carboxypeptidase domain-containing protein [Kofleriaceae bacterium]
MTELVEAVRERLAAGKPIRRTIAGGGRLHLERPLPFLCVYRAPAQADPGTADLVRTQASYMIAPAGLDIGELAETVVGLLAETCGACMVLELWSSESLASSRFRIRTTVGDRFATTIDALAGALRAMQLPDLEPTVEVIAGEPTPPGLPALVDPQRPGVLSIGLEVPPLYRSATAVYPTVSRVLTRELTQALLAAFFEFARVQTATPPEHVQLLGRRRMVRAVRESDLALSEIGASFDFLLAISPINVDAAWQEFCVSGRTVTPRLHYRMLELDPALGKRRLYDLPIDRLEDPALAQLLHDKRRELDRQLGLLEDRDTPRFVYGSLQLYGDVEVELLADARTILATVPRGTPVAASPRCDAEAFATHARAELAYYRETFPALATTVEIRDDVASLVVSHGDLLIPRSLDVAAHRVHALLQHELGTHVVTYANGRAQPLRVLAGGLAGYEALQEGLATFVEYLVGGLDGERLRLIAARVVAVHRMLAGESFPRIVAELVDEYQISVRSAFTIALRVVRGGGLTKDAIYLRGLTQLLAYLRAGRSLAPLLVGKLALEQVPLIEELLRRELLLPPTLSPRWLSAAGSSERLARAAAGLRVIDLAEGNV